MGGHFALGGLRPPLDTMKECAQKDYEISRMKEKLSTLECRIKAKEEIIEQLRGECKDKCMNIHTLESDMDELMTSLEEDDAHHVCDPVPETETHIVAKITEVMGNQMKILETMIEKSIDKKLLLFQTNPVTPEKPTYADIAKDNLRRRNEQVTREREKCLRKNNVIIHGRTDKEDENADKIFIANLMKHLRLENITPSMVTRIGGSGNGKNRPMKMTFVSARDKDRFMNELKLLKGNIEYTGISITADYTREERLLIKELVEKAKAANKKLSKDCDYTWKVRGTPDTGVEIKCIRKKTDCANTRQEKAENNGVRKI